MDRSNVSLPQESIYYIDQCGIDTYIYREYAYAPKGVKVIGNINGKKFKRTNIVAAKCESDIVAAMIYDGTTDSILFEHWFEHMFLKAVPKGSWFVLDNATFPRKPILRELTQRAGCFIEFLPPYSPECNPS